MAIEWAAGKVLEFAVSRLSEAVLAAIKKTYHFKSELEKMQETIQRIRPVFMDMETINKDLDQREAETKQFMNLLKEAERLVHKCEEINWDLVGRHRHAKKLDDMNESLLKYVQFDLQLQMARNQAETLAVAKRLEKGLEKGSSRGVPSEKCVAIGFDDRLKILKTMVLKDSSDGDCSVVVVSAAGGCGKTTLVTMLCHDPDIKAKFDGNIYYAKIPEKYDIKVVIKNLLEREKLPDFDSNEAAIQHWGSFLDQNKSEILLVLDNVRSDSIIKDLKFKSPRYKILATSREAFNEYKTYGLPFLNDQDAIRLFRRSAFSEDGNENSNIPEELVDELINCCKNHPLALSVIGGSLMRKPLPSWILMSKNMSKGNKSFSNFHKYIQDCLKRSLYLFDEEPKIKQCYLDLGLFPEDQKIAATVLMDMWAQLYGHDDDGVTTMDSLNTLSSKNLAALLPKRKTSLTIAHHCHEEFVMQHDMMRELAIHLSGEQPIECRERLILNTYVQDLPKLPRIVNARILSVSTGVTKDERFPLTWDEIQAPNLEVLVLNFMVNMLPLPQFVQHMKKLKVLIITNYGYYFSEIQNFPAPRYLSGLTRIWLDHVSISSISTAILMLENLQKLSLIMCKIGNCFNEGIPNKLTSLLEINIESCDDLYTFPAMLCNVVGLKKLSITNCHELTSLSKDFGNLSNLEVLRLASCTNLSVLPESIRNLKKLRIIDLFYCLRLSQLPLHIGELDSLETIDATGCTNLQELPESVNNFNKLKVVCDEEISNLWSGFKNVVIEVVEEDLLNTFSKINP